MKSYRKNAFFSDCKFMITDCFKQNRFRLILILLLAASAFILGIIIAIKTSNPYYCGFMSWGVVDISGGFGAGTFFSRLFSMIVIMLLLFGCCFSKFTFPIAIAILCYRMYLVGLTLCLMFLRFGLPGIIITLLVALPCQLLIFCVLGLFYLLCCNNRCDIFCFGRLNNRVKLLIICFTILFAICVIETLLLLIFNAKIILVI